MKHNFAKTPGPSRFVGIWLLVWVVGVMLVAARVRRSYMNRTDAGRFTLTELVNLMDEPRWPDSWPRSWRHYRFGELHIEAERAHIPPL